MKKLLFLFTALLINALSIGAQTRYTTTNLNLRYGPGINYSIVTVLPKGTTVTIEDNCDCKWVPVSYKGRIGYIRTLYLSRNKIGTNSARTNKKRNYRKSYYTRNVSTLIATGTEYNLLLTIIQDQRVQPPSVEMGLIALVKAIVELAPIMVVWLNGIDK